MAKSIVNAVLDFRIPMDVEYQGWVLLFATMTAMFCFCMPCYCAGLSWAPARRFAAWLSQRLPVFLAGMLLFNGFWMFFVVTWLPDWTIESYLKILAKGFGWFVSHLLKFMTSIVMIVVFCFVVAFKDRILLLLGLDHRTIFKCKLRDFLSCWNTSRFRPIDMTIWKVEDLASADVFSANNVYLEMYLGYNEAMRTRVHNNAGSACAIKETIQLNYDDGDDEENLHIFVKNQKVMGATELGRLELKGSQLKELEKESQDKLAKAKSNPQTPKWDESAFCSLRLIPRGMIWFRIASVDDEDGLPNSYKDFTTC